MRSAGIAFEIVPGVSSACAAAAAAGIPLSRRLNARRVQFVTGHDITGDLPDHSMAALADPAAATVVFMPKRTFPALVRALVAAGLAGDTPALIAENVGYPDQSIVRGTIAAIAADLERDVSDRPALILYGALMDEA